MVFPNETPSVRYPLIFSGHWTRGTGYHEFRRKGSDDWLVIHTITGTGQLVIPSKAPIYVEPGQTALYRPGARQEYATDPARGRWELLWAHFHPPAAWEDDLLSWPEPAPGTFHLPRPVHSIYRRALRALRSMIVLESGPWRQRERLAMNALEEAVLWLTAASASNDQPSADPQITAAQKYLCDNLASEISLSVLAEATAQSVSKLSHGFGRQTGQSPRAYLEQQRMLRAARLLAKTKMPIKTIAAQVGFSNPFYFSLRFKKSMGLSPRHWRDSNAASIWDNEQRAIKSRNRK